jgi:hypothetical protein
MGIYENFLNKFLPYFPDFSIKNRLNFNLILINFKNQNNYLSEMIKFIE